MFNMKCPVHGCGWEIGHLIDTSGRPMDDQDLIDSVTTQHSLMVEHLQDDHDGRVGGR
jgi:hypothetical protein